MDYFNGLFSDGEPKKKKEREVSTAGSATTDYFGNSILPDSYFTPAAPVQQERVNTPGLMSDIKRASGQFISGAGSTLRDIGAEQLGGNIEQYGTGIIQRNPSEITSFSDVLSRPFTTAREAVGEVAPQVGLAVGGQVAGRVVGGALGIPFGPAGIAVGQQVGGFVGGLLPAAVQTYGGIRSEQREKGIEEKGRALAVTIPAALLERFGGAERVALRVAGEGTEFLARELGTNAYKAAAKQFARGGVEELVTELPQTALERYGVTGEAADLTSPEAMNEYGVAGAKAFLGGGAIRTGLSVAAGTRKDPMVTIQPDGTITSDQPLTGADGELDLTNPNNVITTAADAAKKLSEFDPYAVIAERAAAGRPMSAEEATQFLSSSLAAQKAGQQYIDLMQSKEDTLGRIGQVGEQYQRMVGRRGDQLLGIQEVGDLVRPIVSRLQDETQQQEAPYIAAAQAGAGAQQLPGMLQGAGTKADYDRIMNPDVMQPVAPQGYEPLARTDLLPAQPAPFSNMRLDRPGPQESLTGLTSQLSERPVAIAPLGESTPLPSAPVAGGVSSKTQKQAEPAATVEDDKALGKLLSDVDTVDVGNPLPATVRGAATVKAPGRTSIGLPMLKKIRDALLRPSGKVGAGAGEQEQKIVDALNSFAEAYKVYLDKGGKLLRVKDQKNLDKASQEKFDELQVFAENVRATLADVGKAVNGNAKDVEAIVRLVKDMAQGRIVVPGKTRSEVIQAGKKLDTMLSQAWASAKRETFMGETVDLADVRSGDVRQSKEVAATGEMSPIERAATEGIGNPKNKGQKYTGLAGILQYIRNSGTPFERQLAYALREALDDQENPVKVKFIDKGNSYFDPKTTTVYLSRNESPEVVIHEAFHAALQSFVYKNPKDPAVMQLKKSLKQVVDFKGELTGKAKEVQDLLKKLVAEKKELDAVLELISYNNTLNDFRKALQAMPTKGVPASFREAANSIWRAIKNITRRMLGSTDSVASDVLQSSIDLLERSRTQTVEAGLGNVLKAEITSASKINPQDYREYNKKVAPAALSTKFVFDLVGWQRGAEKVSELSSKLATTIRKDFPTAERYITYLNSTFGVNVPTIDAIRNYKINKNTGYQRMEQLANFVESRSAEEANALFDYLDGNKKALDKFADAGKIKEIADSVDKSMALYISQLPEKDQAYFKGTKFSESLLFAGNTNQVASHTFGARKLSEIIGLQHRFEETIEGFQHWMGKDKNGDVDITGPFYQVFGPNIKDPAGPQVPQGYMSIKEFNAKGNPVGFTVDPSRQWRISGKKGEGYKFTSNMTAQQAILEKKVTSLANAMRNTMAALANNYASRNFSKAAAEIGYEDGKPTALSVAFNSVADVKKVFGSAPDESQILNISKDESKTPQIADLYRNSNTWVRIPNVPAYGDLAGKIMPGPVWSAMTDMSDRKPLVAFRPYNALMRWFKKSKTVYNPGTHVTNIASNVTLAMMHDIPVSTMGSAAKLFAKYELNAKDLNEKELAIMSQFMNSGAMLGDYSSAEVKEAIYKAWSENLSQPTDTSLLQRLKMFTGYEKSKAQMGVALAAKFGNKIDNVASELYAAEDNIFRLAAFMKKVGELQEKNGETTPSAETYKNSGDFAREAFLDYDIDSKAVRLARQSFLPFVSWLYAITPVMGRIAMHQPWKIANVMMVYYLIDAAMASAAGDDDEEKRKQGPEYVRERMFGIGPYMHIRIPFMGDDNNPVYYRLGDYVPMASAAKGLPNGFMGQSWFPGSLTPSGPLISAISGMVLGVDPYTGKPIHQPTDSDWDKLGNVGKFAYDIVTPPAFSSRQAKAVSDILADKTGPTGAPVSDLAIARSFGLKLYEFNVDESAYYKSVEIRKLQRDYRAAMTKAARDEYRKGKPDPAALEKEIGDLRERLMKAIENARGEE